MIRMTLIGVFTAGAGVAHAGDIFHLDFDTQGAGYSTSVSEFVDSSSRYFSWAYGDGRNLLGNDIRYYRPGGTSNDNGFFAAQNVGGSGTEMSLTTDSIDISDASDLMFSIELAEDTERNGGESWNAEDFVSFTYRVDGGSWEEMFSVEPNSDNDNTRPLFDGDRSNAITHEFRAYTFDLSGIYGDIIEFQVFWNLTDADVDLAIDNLLLTGTTVAVVPLPAAGWAGLGMLGLLGAARMRRS